MITTLCFGYFRTGVLPVQLYLQRSLLFECLTFRIQLFGYDKWRSISLDMLCRYCSCTHILHYWNDIPNWHILQILGLVLLIIGCIVKFNKELVTKYADELFKVIKLESANLNLDELLSSSAVVFIIVGVVILIVGVLGCLGACCGWRAFLVIVRFSISVIITT